MRTAIDHARRYPNCRVKTLTHLIEFERKTAQLRKEVRWMRIKRVLKAIWRG